MNREQFEKKEVFLWGLKKANKKLLEEFDKGDQHPNRRVRKPKEEGKEEVKPAIREFIVGDILMPLYMKFVD